MSKRKKDRLTIFYYIWRSNSSVCFHFHATDLLIKTMMYFAHIINPKFNNDNQVVSYIMHFIIFFYFAIYIPGCQI